MFYITRKAVTQTNNNFVRDLKKVFKNDPVICNRIKILHSFARIHHINLWDAVGRNMSEFKRVKFLNTAVVCAICLSKCLFFLLNKKHHSLFTVIL